MVSERLDLMNECARERAGMPVGWRWFRFESRPPEGPAQILILTGCMEPQPITRGKYKGTPNWKKRDRTTERTVYITPAERDEWLLKWERKTGKCSDCSGTGVRWCGWSGKHGAKYEPCKKCEATGNSRI